MCVCGWLHFCIYILRNGRTGGQIVYEHVGRLGGKVGLVSWSLYLWLARRVKNLEGERRLEQRKG